VASQRIRGLADGLVELVARPVDELPIFLWVDVEAMLIRKALQHSRHKVSLAARPGST
jgi:hypothetical protein